MGANAETEMRRAFPGDVESVRVFEYIFIAITGAASQDDFVSLAYELVANRRVTGGGTSHVDYW